MGGKIIIHEILLNENKTAPFLAISLSVGMLRRMNGKQYSFEELKDMLDIAGFKNVRSEPTGFDKWSVVVAEKL